MSKASTPKSTPQAGSMTSSPNLVGQRFSPDEFNGRFVITAAIQKIANLPAVLAPENFANSTDKLEFRLTLTANTSGDGIAGSICKTPQVSASFTPAMIRKARGSGQFEVSFVAGASNSGNNSIANESASSSSLSTAAVASLSSSSSSATWIVQAEGRNQLVGKCAMRIQLQECINGTPYRVLYDQSSPVVLQKVLDRKVLVFLYGCPIGRIGVTLSVSAEDQVGYKKRMDRFLAQFSASPDPQIASSIMSKCDEITTFAYLWKRYGIVDYSARLRRFLNLYSRHLAGQEEALLSKYKMHEEEMFMTLVLDNGPEELDIDARKRLDAFKTKYFMTSLDADKESQRSFADFLSYMDRLVEQNGAEPDPRTYLFPDPNYKPPPGMVQQNGNSSTSPSPASPQQQLTNPSDAISASATTSSPAKSTTLTPGSSSPLNNPFSSTQQQQQLSTSSSSSSVAAAAAVASPISLLQQQVRSSSAQQQQGRMSFSAVPAASPAFNNNNNNSNNSNSNSNSAVIMRSSSSSTTDLWGSFISSLAAKRVSSSDIFFLSDDAFLSLVAQVGVNSNHRHLVVSEWKRRAAENLQLIHYAPNDPSFDAVRAELLTLAGMQPINLSVLGVVGLRNIEHEATHAARLSLMNEGNRVVERCVYAGEYNTLLRCAERGITAIMNPTDSGLCFPRHPFAHLEKPTAVSVLVCDVIAGFQTNAPTVKEAALAKSDTVAVGVGAVARNSNGNGGSDANTSVAGATDEPGLFVRDVRHVLPRFIVHCHVDPTLVACPLHPTKQVEYYVVDLQTFACSNCVVLGPHVGKPIVTLEEALQWARTQLNDILKDAEQCGSAASELDRDMSQQLDSITGENAKKRKQELIESIRREAELRAQDAAKQLEAEMAVQADVIKAQLQRVAPLKSALSQTSRAIQNTVRQGNVAKALDLLQTYSQTYDGNDYRQKVNEVKQTLTMMPQLSHDGSRAPWAFASNQSIRGIQHPSQLRQNQQQSTGSRSNSQQQRQQQQAFHHDPLFAANNSSSSSTGNNGGFSRFMEAASTIAVNRAASSASNRGGFGVGTPHDNSLYNKFVSASQSQSQSQSQVPPSPGGQSSGSSRFEMNNNNNNANLQQQQQQQQGRELLQDGWKSFRRGDAATARSLWSTANDRYPNTAVGARAMAYISEAIEKDAVKAGEYYERALQCDPTDCMTLFNYGVLLEATGHTLRALQLFESAQRLGDAASGKRARAIRQQQLASSGY